MIAMLGNKGIRRILISFMLYFGAAQILSAQLSVGQSIQKKRYSSGQIIPLNIGDKCPDFLFKKIINSKNTSGKLSDYKGKLIILDFWSTYCSSCIADFPKKQLLQDKFGDSISIILVADQPDASTLVPAFWLKNNTTKKLRLPCVIDEEANLMKYFPRDAIGLQVIIDKNGFVKAITTHEYITKQNVQSLLEGDSTYIYNNRLLPFNQDKPLITEANLGEVKPKIQFYSAVFGFLPNISNKFEIMHSYIDSLEDCKNIKFYNFAIQGLYLTSLQSFHPFFTHASESSRLWRVIWDLSDSSRYIRPRKSIAYEWYEKNAICYEAKVPLGTSDSAIYRNLHHDLGRFYGLTDNIKSILVDCLLLKALDPLHSETENKFRLDTTSVESASVQPIDNLVYKLVGLSGQIVIDSMDLKKNIFVPKLEFQGISENTFTIESCNKILMKVGLCLVQAKKKLDFYVISDKPKL